MSFPARMAWRDFKAKPSRYFFYMLTVALGTMSLFAVESFRTAITQSIKAEGRELLGADIRLQSIRPFTSDQLALVETWTGSVARLVSYRTMLLKSGTSQTRLVEVQAFDEAFPFYGRIESDPAASAGQFHRAGTILLDQVLAMQMDLNAGGKVMFNGREFVVAGAITRTPGDIPARSLVAPRVFMPLSQLDEQRMRQPGVMARFEYFLASRIPLDDGYVSGFIAAARAIGLHVETMDEHQADLLGDTDRLTRYLGLIGFAALVISCLGIMGAVYFFIQSKRQTVAQLRCIGSGIWTAFGVFLIQLAFIAVSGSGAGILLGFAAAHALSSLFAGFLPADVNIPIQFDSAILSFGVSLWFTTVSGLLPMVALRHIPPVYSLRVDSTDRNRRGVDWLTLMLMVILVASFAAASILQLGNARMALVYIAGLLVILILLAGTGWMVRKGCVALIRAGWSYTARLAISGMYRPQNQTIMMVVCMGLGVFLISTLDTLEQHVIDDLRSLDQNRPNLAMIDIQPDQREPLTAVLNGYEPASVFMEPMITMRLVSINGQPVAALERRQENRPEEWALKREFRTTYRNHLKPDIEKVIAGEWVSHYVPGTMPVPVSLEEGIAEALRVSIGDRILFDIHGTLLETKVANLREADWKSMQPNFFIVFPVGVIDEAPQSILLFCSLSNLQHRAAFQARLVQEFPNVTAIDISLMMNALTRVAHQLSSGIKSIALVTLAAGLAVMMAVIRSGRMARVREAILLRTLGSRSRLVVGYQVLELSFLSLMASISGLLLSFIASWAVIRFGMNYDFDARFVDPWWILFTLQVLVIALGVSQARGALRMRPAESWRALSIGSS